MHALNLLELATTFSQHADACLKMGIPFRKEAAHTYWLTCRYRHDVWSERLARHRAALPKASPKLRQQHWFDILPTIQEILLSEPLTRCVTQHALAMEEHGVDSDFGALAQSAMTAHVEARHRCLHLIVFGTGLSAAYTVQLNRIRKHCEIFSDDLLAVLRTSDPSMNCSFDAERTAACRSEIFGSGMPDYVLKTHCAGLMSWFLRNTSLDIDYRQANPKQTSSISAAVLGLLASEAFDSFGLPISIRAARLRDTIGTQQVTDQAPNPEGWSLDKDSIGKYVSPLDILSKVTRPQFENATPKRW